MIEVTTVIVQGNYTGTAKIHGKENYLVLSCVPFHKILMHRNTALKIIKNSLHFILCVLHALSTQVFLKSIEKFTPY